MPWLTLAAALIGAPDLVSSAALASQSPSELSSADGMTALVAVGHSEQAFVLLVVNTVVKNSILVTLDGHDVIAQRKDLLLAGIDLSHAPAGDTVSLNGLRPGVTFHLDADALRLSLAVAPALLPNQVIDMRPGRPADLTFRKDTSVYVNYDLRLADFTNLTTAVELGASIAGAFLYSSATLNSANWMPVRGLSNLTFNSPDKMERWVLGDAFVNTGMLGGSEYLGGVTFGRSFNLNPYFVPRPTLGYSGAVSTPSTMDVYVNDVLVKRETVQPGTFSVQNLTATTGGGNYRYVLHDAFGNTSEVQSPYYLPRLTLPRGVTDFSLSLGFERNNLATESFDYGTLAFMGNFRRGLSDWLTGGGRAEGSIAMFSAGTTWAARIPIGELDLDGATSFDSGRFGGAGSLAYSYLTRVFSTSLFVRGLSDYYATLSTRAVFDRPLFDAGITVSVPIQPLRISLTAGYADEIMRDTGSEQTVSGSFYVRLASRVFFDATGLIDFPLHGPRDYTLFTGLSVQIDMRTTAALSWTQTQSGGSALATIDHTALLGTGVGYNAYVGYPPGGQATFGGFGQYQSPYGIHSASFDYADGKGHATFETSGGVAVVGKSGIFATRPIQTGFANVSVPGIKGVRVFLNNQEVGRTDSAGQVLVPGMLPYYGNRVSIADTDVPIDYRLDSIEQVVAGPEGGGVAVTFIATRVHYYRGVLEVPYGHRSVRAKDGELQLVGRDGAAIVTPLGRDGRFEIDSLPAGTYRATIDWQGGRCGMTLVVPASSETVINLGVLRCH